MFRPEFWSKSPSKPIVWFKACAGPALTRLKHGLSKGHAILRAVNIAFLIVVNIAFRIAINTDFLIAVDIERVVTYHP